MAANEPLASKKMHRLLLLVDFRSGNDEPSDSSLLFTALCFAKGCCCEQFERDGLGPMSLNIRFPVTEGSPRRSSRLPRSEGSLLRFADFLLHTESPSMPGAPLPPAPASNWQATLASVQCSPVVLSIGSIDRTWLVPSNIVRWHALPGG